VSSILAASSPGVLASAADALAAGQLVVIPTDTVYGIAARSDRPEALAALFAAKGRPASLALPVLAADAGQAAQVGRLDGVAGVLAGAFWPGPLTIVVDRAPGFDADLGGDGTTVGLRVPAYDEVLALLALTGPLATTSANRSGQPTPPTAGEVAAVFGTSVALYLDGGPARGGAASSVVSVTGNVLAVLRAGPISEVQLRLAAGLA
jgi:L-threonylcarbamoyladenylate synthase